MDIFIVKAAAYISAAIAIGIGIYGPATGQGAIGTKAVENIGKYPESAGKIQTAMFLSMGIVETCAVYCFLVALILVFK